MPSPHAPPEATPFRGWRIVAALAVLQAAGIGLLNVYGILVDPIAREFGASMASIGAGMSIFILVLGLAGPAVGIAVDRGPLRAVMLGGVVAMGLGLLAMSRAGSLLSLALGLAVLSLGITCYGPLPVNGMIVNWFVLSRGRALALVNVGPALAGFALPPLAAWLLEASSWRTTLAVLAGGGVVIALPVVARFVVRRPEDIGQHPDGRPPFVPVGDTDEPAVEEGSLSIWLRDRDFWLMALGFGLVFSVPIGTGLYLVPFMVEQGIETQHAAYALSSLAFFALLGSLGAGTAADRIDPRAVLVALLAAYALALCTIVLWPRYAVILVATVGLGLGAGGVAPLPPLFIGRRFGRLVVGRVMGMQGPIGLPFMLVAAPLAGLLRDRSGSFGTVFFGAAAALVLAAILLVCFRLDAPEVPAPPAAAPQPFT